MHAKGRLNKLLLLLLIFWVAFAMNVLQHTRNELNLCLKQNRPDRSYRDTLLRPNRACFCRKLEILLLVKGQGNLQTKQLILICT